MRKIKEVLRLKFECGLSNRKIAATCGISRPTVSEYLRRAETAGGSERRFQASIKRINLEG